MSKNQATDNAEWHRKWELLGQRISQFPEWMQVILLDDIDTAIQNRIAVFQKIENKTQGAK